MPNWKTHIEVAKRLNKKLKFKNEKLEEFMIGNLLADINNGFVVKGISTIYNHKHTHYEDNGGITYINFYNQYKDRLNEPIVLGYYVHLYTDYLWNNDFYTRLGKNIKFCEYTSEELKKIKHDDFKLYNNKYIDNIINIENVNNIVNKSRSISNISINYSDVIKVIEFLKVQNTFNSDYSFYNEKELDELLEDTVNKMLQQIIVYL